MNKIIEAILGEDNIALFNDVERILDQIGANVSDYYFGDLLDDTCDTEFECVKILISAFIDRNLLPYQYEDYDVMFGEDWVTCYIDLDYVIEVTEEDIEQFKGFEEITGYKIKYNE